MRVEFVVGFFALVGQTRAVFKRMVWSECENGDGDWEGGVRRLGASSENHAFGASRSIN